MSTRTRSPPNGSRIVNARADGGLRQEGWWTERNQSDDWCGSAGNRCLPSDLRTQSEDFHTLYKDLMNDKQDHEDAAKTKASQEEEVTMKLGELQDTCPGLFAHRTAQDAFQAIEALDLLNGYGLPIRY